MNPGFYPVQAGGYGVAGFDMNSVSSHRTLPYQEKYQPSNKYIPPSCMYEQTPLAQRSNNTRPSCMYEGPSSSIYQRSNNTQPSCMYEQPNRPSCMYEQPQRPSCMYEQPQHPSGLYLQQQQPWNTPPMQLLYGSMYPSSLHQIPEPSHNRSGVSHHIPPNDHPASDSDSSDDEAEKPKRKLKGKIQSVTGKYREVYNADAKRILRAAFAKDRYLNFVKEPQRTEELARETGLSMQRIKNWFQNERAKNTTKKKAGTSS